MVSGFKIKAKQVIPAGEDLLKLSPEQIMSMPTMSLKMELSCDSSFMADLVKLLQSHGVVMEEPKAS